MTAHPTPGPQGAPEWRAMPAGRELDVLVARAIGWTMVVGSYAITSVRVGKQVRPAVRVTEDPNKLEWTGVAPEGVVTVELPYFSDDLGAAWEAVEEVQRRNPGWRFSLLGGDVSYGYKGGDYRRGVDETREEAFGWHAEFHGHIDPRENHGQRHADEWGETAPLAICRAALAAMEAADAR